MPERVIDKQIMELLEEYRGRGLRFRNFFITFTKRGTFHGQSDISKNLQLLLNQKKIVKVRGLTRSFYGIPLTRENGSKYLIINQGLEDEEIEIKEVCKPKEPQEP